MFENIIGQDAVFQIRDDFFSHSLAPSMLFFGPSESGKGCAALELARGLSCENDSSWKCACPSCERHRYLQHTDLLVLGPRNFPAEISACHSAFLRNPENPGVKILFIRCLRKLQMRFSPVLMEDDPKLNKFSPVLQSLEEGLSEFHLTNTETVKKTELEKLCGCLLKDALSLVNAGLSGIIPVGHIRRASYWCRLAPNGRRKALLIENAENMRDDAGNSLLKLLEEPPDTVTIILTSQRRKVIMPTILSRLRQYRFYKRSAENEKEVIRRVFQDSLASRPLDEKSLSAGSCLISAYLDSFMPSNNEKLYQLAAWFLVCMAQVTGFFIKKNNADIPRIINTLTERYAQIASLSGLEYSSRITVIVKTLLAQSNNFENSSFSRFLEICLELTAALARNEENPQFIAFNDLIRKLVSETQTSVEVLNQNLSLALESLLYKLKTSVLKKSACGSVYG